MHAEDTALSSQEIRRRADALADTVRAHRRRIHRRPELGFDEHETAAYVEAQLDRLGITHRRVAGTGIVAVIGEGSRCIGVRADMDALPVPEATGRDGYRSEIDGLSHACGHDAHVAMALGLAELLTGSASLPGCVVLYFQPAEEGPGGAAPMVRDGALDDPAPQAVVALHVASDYPVGTVAVRGGTNSASDDTIRITVRGVGGHAAYPHRAVDPVPVAAEVILALQHLVSREVDPVHPVVCTFGAIHGGTRHNVIAGAVTLDGTVRALHQHHRDLMLRRIPEVAEAVAGAHRCEVDITIEPGYGVGVNDLLLTDLVESAAQAVVPADRIVREPDPGMGAEDFYAFGDTGLPVTMFNLGVANPEKGIGAPHHSPDFDLDEDALPDGVAVLAETVRRFLTAGSATAEPAAAAAR